MHLGSLWPKWFFMKWYFEDRLQNWSKLEMLTVVLHTFVCCVRTLLIANNRLYPRTSKSGLCRNCTVFHSDTRKSRLFAQYLLMNGLKFNELTESDSEQRIQNSLLRRGRVRDQLSFGKLDWHHWLCSWHFVDGRPSPDKPHQTLLDCSNSKMAQSPRTPVSKTRGCDQLTTSTAEGQWPLLPRKLTCD